MVRDKLEAARGETASQRGNSRELRIDLISGGP
jgi:hypothetical protein